MSKQLQVLVIDDSPGDANLIARELRQNFGEMQVERVETPGALKGALQLGRWDVVISDNRMPELSGMEALQLVKACEPDLPFILFTGTMGEEAAVETLKAGVDDYVLKDNLSRLAPAFKRQLQEAEQRRERRRSLDVLRESEERLRQLAENIDLFFYLTDVQNSKIFYASPAYEKITGRSVDTLYANPRSWLPLVHPEDRGELVERVELAAVGPVETRYRILRTDGTVRWVNTRRFPVRDHTGKAYRIAGIVEDITERKEAEEKIARLNRVYAVLSRVNALIVRVRNREELYREACRIAVEAGQLRMAWLGVYDANAMSITPVAVHGHEDGFLRLVALNMNYPIAEGRGLVRRAIREKRPVILNDIEHDTKFRLRAEALARGYRSGAVLPLLAGGEVAGVLGLFAGDAEVFDDGEMRLLTELAGDISFALEHIEKSEKLDYLAYYDALTGLAHRTLFFERLNQGLQAAGQAGGKLALIVVDIERFKTINDSLGRQAGDELLKQVAKRMTQANGDSARLARVGGDQFAAIVLGLKQEDEVARILEEQSLIVFGPAYQVSETELRVGAKAGIALFPSDGGDAETLFMNAEAALKKAKATGERYLFYTQGMTERVAEKLSLENKLRQALENEEFVLHYQPKVDVETRRIVGVEALIRWRSRELGLVPPMQFIPLMEETGLILEVGAWALRRAVLDYREWVNQGLAAPRIAVNVSAIQLRRPDFVDALKSVVCQGAMRPAIDLEITESVVMEDIQRNIEKLNAIRTLNVGIAIDDFGTGYSSLAYLAKLPVDTLKIDRSFIKAMLNDPATMTLVQTIISLARSLKLSVVAEGVESEEQANMLRLLRCDQMQGYLMAKPQTRDGMTALLRASGERAR